MSLHNAYFINKKQLIRSFNQAANTYEQYATFQRRVGDLLFTKIPDSFYPKNILDVGHGTGYFTQALSKHFSGADVFGLDIAINMSKVANNKYQCISICADMESTPLRNHSFDFIFTNLALQWSNDLHATLNELHRLLKPGGYIVFTTLGSNSLYELRTSWEAVDNKVHVNRFVTQDCLISNIKRANLVLDSLEKKHYVNHHASLIDLMDSLKKIGAHNITHGKPRGLMSKERFLRFKHSYQAFQDAQGMLPASYEVFFGLLRKQ